MEQHLDNDQDPARLASLLEMDLLDRLMLLWCGVETDITVTIPYYSCLFHNMPLSKINPQCAAATIEVCVWTKYIILYLIDY